MPGVPSAAISGQTIDKPKARPVYYDTVDPTDREAIMTAVWGEPCTHLETEIVRAGALYRAMRDGAGPSSPGIVRPSRRRTMPLQVLGQELLKWVDSQGLPRRLELAAASTFGAADPTPLLANPFEDVDLDELRKWLATAVGGDPLDCLVVAAGQCFYLQLLWQLAFATGDLDLQLLRQLEDGLAMGVEEDLACPDGVLVRRLPREEVDASDDLWPHAEPNYSSAEAPANAQFLKDQFDEDVQEGMMDGPFVCEAEVAAHLGCSTTQLVYGALAVRDEADGKKRALQDGTVVDVNETIRSHIHHKGSSPASGDLQHALAIDAMV